MTPAAAGDHTGSVRDAPSRGTGVLETARPRRAETTG